MGRGRKAARTEQRRKRRLRGRKPGHQARPGFAKHKRKADRALAERRRQREQAHRERDELVSGLYGRRGHGACGRKVRYPTLHKAERVAARRAAFGVDGLSVYRCPYCGGWHLTSHPDGRERA